MQPPGTIRWPLEERRGFPLNMPGWSENVTAVFEGDNRLPSQTTGALIINAYSVTQLLCRSTG